MPERERFAPEERDPEIEIHDVAPPDMPPAPAGANAEIGGEAAASRRLAGLPPELARESEELARRPPEPEPFLGYDGLALDEVLAWLAAENPEPDILRRIIEYESMHRDRATILEECRTRLERWQGDG